MKKNITLKDIALALKVSVSTVSRALRDNYQISAETKKAVLDYARTHNFVPNRMARSLKEGKSRTIGVIICSLNNQYVAQMLEGIDSYCSEKGYQLIIMQSKELQEHENECIDLLYASGIDGLLISPAYQNTNFEKLQDLQKAGIPIVVFDRLSEHIHTNKVASNNFKGAYEATVHLINNGYRKIAHLNTNTKLSITSERLNGYLKALKDHHITYNEAYVRYVDFSTDDLEEIINSLMLLPDKPDALLTATDQITLKCVSVLAQSKYEVPSDLAFIGFSNTEMADAFHPPLTTVRQPTYEIGRTAAQKLIESIKRSGSPSDFETILLDTSIQVRSSTKKCS
ncbi:LacI family DNA-binding transcriptional regulator [Pedobacter sp.]|uniref:LacI family DNA-binding transcriptional regulator n=1 Tax=Pedobacter sp. TaxID=1411316 RepID=UPI003D7FE73B